MCEQCTRREFMGTAGMLGGMASAASNLAVGTETPGPFQAPASKVRIWAMAAGEPADQSWGTPEAEIEAAKQRLAEAEKSLGNVEFVVGQATNAEEAAQLLEQAGPDAPVLAISASIFGLSRVIPLLRQTRVLVSPPFKGTPASFDAQQVKQRLGVQLVAIADQQYDEALAAVDEADARAEATRWIEGAKQVVEPSEENVAQVSDVLPPREWPITATWSLATSSSVSKSAGPPGPRGDCGPRIGRARLAIQQTVDARLESIMPVGNYIRVVKGGDPVAP